MALATGQRQSDNYYLAQIAANIGAGGAGGASTIANGADVAEGSTTDAVVAAGAAGTVSAKLRRLTTDLALVSTAAKQPALGTSTAASSDVLSVSSPALTLVNSTANEASRVLKASPGKLHSLSGYSARTSSQFIQLFNSTTVPADTAVPVLTFTVPASSNFSFDFGFPGIPLSTGIAVSNSGTQQTKTIGSADVYYTAVVV